MSRLLDLGRSLYKHSLSFSTSRANAARLWSAELTAQRLIDLQTGQLVIVDLAQVRALAQADLSRLRRRKGLHSAGITSAGGAGHS